MENISPFTKSDILQEFRIAISDQGRKYNWIAEKMGISPTHLNNIFKMRAVLTEDNRKKLNELLNTSI